MTPTHRWPFPSGCLLAVAVSIMLWPLFIAAGSLEWAAYDDWRSQHERARFFGFASRELPASMTS